MAGTRLAVHATFLAEIVLLTVFSLYYATLPPTDLEVGNTIRTDTEPFLNVKSVVFHGRTIVATVRSATEGIPTAIGTVLPFELDGIAGTHNGFLRRFRETTAARCLATLPEDLVGEFEALSDSRAIFLLAVSARREDPDLSLADALVGAVGTAARICATVEQQFDQVHDTFPNASQSCRFACQRG